MSKQRSQALSAELQGWIANVRFTRYTDEANKEWDLTGEPAYFGEFYDDVNQDYVDFREKIQPYIDEYNQEFV